MELHLESLDRQLNDDAAERARLQTQRETIDRQMAAVDARLLTRKEERQKVIGRMERARVAYEAFQQQLKALLEDPEDT